ncbi:hypothetical protein LGM42_01890 [Burkholderia sp. AU39826]|uniref:hypothetical protein n=1 Tax=Burkholderia sp. AU39826 TaxID=2879634 RepID=UPI001CF4FEA6|nr:hypothetical protein [Burkholderia sp. AU39826]MCA7968636.1 hypothetical protein [Burkholderia sp. AU39826]
MDETTQRNAARQRGVVGRYAPRSLAHTAFAVRRKFRSRSGIARYRIAAMDTARQTRPPRPSTWTFKTHE